MTDDSQYVDSTAVDNGVTAVFARYPGDSWREQALRDIVTTVVGEPQSVTIVDAATSSMRPYASLFQEAGWSYVDVTFAQAREIMEHLFERGSSFTISGEAIRDGRRIYLSHTSVAHLREFMQGRGW